MLKKITVLYKIQVDNIISENKNLRINSSSILINIDL